MRGEDVQAKALITSPVGSPPLARGRLPLSLIDVERVRLTPACAGKTKSNCEAVRYPQAHPRLRGEDCSASSTAFGDVGSPPLARGRLGLSLDETNVMGLTPACAGKTEHHHQSAPFFRAHPRLRGEDEPLTGSAQSELGSPPLARGRLLHGGIPQLNPGLTPACAGKTTIDLYTYGDTEAHPRLRGEDQQLMSDAEAHRGSPPLARGRRRRRRRGMFQPGLTPACAGKTRRLVLCNGVHRAHPRLRGEDRSVPSTVQPFLGSPPLARGRRKGSQCFGLKFRLTPACAGKTLKIVRCRLP